MSIGSGYNSEQVPVSLEVAQHRDWNALGQLVTGLGIPVYGHDSYYTFPAAEVRGEDRRLMGEVSVRGYFVGIEDPDADALAKLSLKKLWGVRASGRQIPEGGPLERTIGECFLNVHEGTSHYQIATTGPELGPGLIEARNPAFWLPSQITRLDYASLVIESVGGRMYLPQVRDATRLEG